MKAYTRSLSLSLSGGKVIYTPSLCFQIRLVHFGDLGFAFITTFLCFCDSEMFTGLDAFDEILKLILICIGTF